MRVVIDINILVSALIVPTGQPAAVIRMWLEGEFTLLTCATHVDDLRATLHKPRVTELIKPYQAGRLVNQVRKLAENVDPLPRVERSPDPNDDYLLWHEDWKCWRHAVERFIGQTVKKMIQPAYRNPRVGPVEAEEEILNRNAGSLQQKETVQ